MIFKIKGRLLCTLLAIAMMVTFIPATVLAVEPLTLLSAGVTTDGGVGLTFNKELSATDLVNKVKAGFIITGLEDTPKTITNVTLHSASGGTNNFVQLYLDPTVKGGEAAGLQYTPSGVQAADGSMLAEIFSMDIDNYAPHPDLLTTAPSAATVGSAYTHTFTVSGGTGPYTFSIDSGNLPSGLTMSSAGVISGTPTAEGSFPFSIMVEDTNKALDIKAFTITVSPSTEKVCEINGTQYTTLDEALAAIGAGESKTITLLKSIDYNKGISFNNKKVSFSLSGYTLNINNPAENGVGLDVQSGGSVSLTGSGELNVTGKAYGVRVTSNSQQTSATVTNATATGSEGRAAYAVGPATITILENATVNGISAYGVHAISGAQILVGGNVDATNEGVYASSSTITVDGNVVASGTDLLGGATGIGVGVYGLTGAVKIGGNVTANRVGAMARAGGSITMDGMLSAPAYIQFADDEPIAIEDFITPTTKEGYRTYWHSTAGTVWMLGDMPTTTYSLTVTNGTGGGSYTKNTVIGITANAAPSGQRFKEWSITPSVTFADSTNKSSQTAKIIMPSKPVAATAVYEPIPTSTHTVTFVLNGGTRTGGGELAQTVPSGGSAIAPTTTRSCYTFTGWDKAFTNVTSNLTVTATWNYNGGGGGGSGGSGSSGSSSAATAGQNGAASVSIPDKAITDAIAKAQSDTKNQANGIFASLNVSMPKGATSFTVTLTQSALSSLVNAGVTSLQLSGAPVSLVLDLAALKEVQKQSGETISIGIAPVSELSAQAKALIGNRPVYQITISTVKDGKTVNVTSLGNGTATLSIPYTPEKNEAVGYLFGVYVDGNGKAIRIGGSAYDANARAILLPTDHFSVYGVGYTAPSARFTDIDTHWGKESIDYVVGRGLLNGTSENTFAPNTAMTRGMLVTALGRLTGVDAKAYPNNSFTDVEGNSVFRPYIEWAYKKGVVQGIGNKQFAPDRAITREEIAVIIANYAKATGYKLPVTREKSSYADASSIGSTFETAVTAMQQAGIMMGDTDNKFNPKASATRAEIASMLHRYMRLTIDPVTVQN